MCVVFAVIDGVGKIVGKGLLVHLRFDEPHAKVFCGALGDVCR